METRSLVFAPLADKTHTAGMANLRACNVQAMYRRMEAMDRQIIRTSSPHNALLFRQHMQAVLAAAPRLQSRNSEYGLFEVETVWEIVRAARTVLQALRLDIDADGLIA